MLAIGETKFSGEPVAVVVADTEDAASTRRALVRIDFEELPAVLSVDAALDATCSARAGLRRSARTIRSRAPTRCSNGNSAGATSATPTAELVIENDYAFPMVTHFAIEPHAFLAAPDANGVTVWSPTQHPYVLQRVVAAALQWPIARVRIVAPDPGGGFGGKGWPKVEPLMAWLALTLGRPVRLVLTLEETFQAARRTSARIHARTGFAKRRTHHLSGHPGGLSARRLRRHRRTRRQQGQLFGMRAVPRSPCAHCRASAAVAHDAEHRVQGVRHSAGVMGRRVAVERGGGRAGHRSASTFAAATFPRKGEAFNPNDTPADGEWSMALEKAAAAIDWERPLAPNRGRGISLGLKSSSTASRSVAIVRLHFDGSASVLCGTSDMGQGARTVMMQIAAQELGLAPDRIAIVMGDTAVVPVRLVHVGEPIDRVHGQRRHRTRATASRSSCGRWPRPFRQPAECRPPSS